MSISFLVFWSVGTTTRYNPDSVNARTIDNYMAIGAFEFRKTIPEDCGATRRLARIFRIRVSFLEIVRYDNIWARQARVT
jgi:hypothetical protein